MKKVIIELLVNMLVQFLKEVLTHVEKQEKEIADQKAAFKSDHLIAEAARKAYPTLSDEKICSELC